MDPRMLQAGGEEATWEEAEVDHPVLEDQGRSLNQLYLLDPKCSLLLNCHGVGILWHFFVS